VDAKQLGTQAAFTSAIPSNVDSLQEFRVTTTNANATTATRRCANRARDQKRNEQLSRATRVLYRTSGTSANDFFNAQTACPRPNWYGTLRRIFAAQ